MKTKDCTFVCELWKDWKEEKIDGKLVFGLDLGG